MVKLTIDGLAVEVQEGTTILKAAQQVGIKIPTLCYHPDQSIKTNCRICVVDIGARTLVPACVYPVSEGMVVYTNSPKVRHARSNILELILTHHPQDCLRCPRNGNCELRALSEELNFTREVRYPIRARTDKVDRSSPSITRDPSKCVVCGRCAYACSEVQSVNALAKITRGFNTIFAPSYDHEIADSPCVNCGQCVQVCPVGALSVHDDTERVWEAIASDKLVVAQVAPAVRITIAEALGEDVGTVSTGRLVTAMKRLGIDVVFDTDFTADLTIIEEGTELLGRLKNGGKLPMITSCSPGWIKFCETYYSDCLDNLSSCKSPQGMFGALIKTYYANKLGKKPSDLYSLSVMPCTAKKFECRRPELGRDGYQDVDCVLTVQELARMIKVAGIDFSKLPETPFDAPFGLGSGAGEIFGATGGVMEAALRTVYEIVTGQELKNIDLVDCRGFDGVKAATVRVGDIDVKIAIAHGLGNARKLMDAVRAGTADFHFIEVMACPGGCIGGGGNPIKSWAKMDKRLEAVYSTDKKLPLRKSHHNPAVNALYKEFLGDANGHRAHELLHTHYTDRSSLIK